MNRFTQGVGLVAKVVLVSSSVALLGAACWKGVGTNTNVGSGNVNAEVNTNVNVNTNSTGEIDTSDWLTFTNEEYGFSFRYPEDWLLNDNSSSISLRTEEVKSEAYLNSMTIFITNKQYETLKNEIEDSDRIDDGTSLAQFSEDVFIEDINGVSAMKGMRATAFGPFMQYYYIPLPSNVKLYIEYFEATAEINNLIEPVINTLKII